MTQERLKEILSKNGAGIQCHTVISGRKCRSCYDCNQYDDRLWAIREAVNEAIDEVVSESRKTAGSFTIKMGELIVIAEKLKIK